ALLLSLSGPTPCNHAAFGTALFDPTTAVWMPASTSINTGWFSVSMTPLPDGRALFANIEGDCLVAHPAAQLFRPDNTTPRLAVNPSPLDFGKVAIGASVEQTITIRNTGQAQLNGTAAFPSGSPFSLVSGATFVLDAGATWLVRVAFTAQSIGSFS